MEEKVNNPFSESADGKKIPPPKGENFPILNNLGTGKKYSEKEDGEEVGEGDVSEIFITI